MKNEPILNSLATEQRLALAYAHGGSKDLFLGLFSLDARLAEILRASAEPMLGQIKLAWWRERLISDDEGRPDADPVLALVRSWQDQRDSLSALVNGWEALLGAPPLDRSDLSTFAQGRAAACGALAVRLDHAACQQEAERAGRCWALGDLASKLSRPDELCAVKELGDQQDWSRPHLPAVLRPLMVLHGLAARSRGERAMLVGPGDLLVAARIGFLGR